VREFCSQEEGALVEKRANEYIPSIIAVRAELMRGDHRALYSLSGWLRRSQYRDPTMRKKARRLT